MQLRNTDNIQNMYSTKARKKEKFNLCIIIHKHVKLIVFVNIPGILFSILYFLRALVAKSYFPALLLVISNL